MSSIITKTTSNPQQGIIRTIVLILIAIIILSVLGIDLKSTVESEMTQRNIGYVKATLITVWNRYLEVPAKFLWNVFIEYIVSPAIDNLKSKTTLEKINSLAKFNPYQLMVPV